MRRMALALLPLLLVLGSARAETTVDPIYSVEFNPVPANQASKIFVVFTSPKSVASAKINGAAVPFTVLSGDAILIDAPALPVSDATLTLSTDGGTINRVLPVREPHEHELIESMIALVAALVARGVIAEGVGDHLLELLGHALKALEAENFRECINILKELLRMLAIFQQQGALPAEIAAALAAQVQTIIQEIEECASIFSMFGLKGTVFANNLHQQGAFISSKGEYHVRVRESEEFLLDEQLFITVRGRVTYEGKNPENFAHNVVVKSKIKSGLSWPECTEKVFDFDYDLKGNPGTVEEILDTVLLSLMTFGTIVDIEFHSTLAIAVQATVKITGFSLGEVDSLRDTAILSLDVNNNSKTFKLMDPGRSRV